MYEIDPLLNLIDGFIQKTSKDPKKTQQIIFTKKLLGKMVSMEEARKSHTPKNLTFIIDEKAIIDNKTITLYGKLINNTTRDEQIIVFPVSLLHPFYVGLVVK